MISRDVAETILEPYMPLFGEPFPAAWAKWKRFGEEYPDLRRHQTPRTRASAIHDWASERAETVLQGMAPDVTLHRVHGFLLIVVEGQLHIRLKKFRSGLRTSGIATGQQQAFADQRPLSGMPEATNLVLGYELNVFQTEIARLAITCSIGERVRWAIEIPEPGGGVVVEPAPQPQEPKSPSIRSTRDREEGRETGS